jgi:hypothetical protein
MLEESIKTTRAVTAANEISAKAIEISEKMGRAQVRAYVGVSAGQIDFTDLRYPVATIEIRNFGQTPAYDLRWWIHSWIEHYPLAVELPEPSEDFPMGQNVMGPGIPSTQGIDLGVRIKDEPFRLLSEGKAAIYIYGGITYRDVFSSNQSTKYMLFFRGNDFGKVSKLSSYIEGNEAT